LSQLNLFGDFSYSHPSGKSTCHFQGNYAFVGDAIREVVWTLFTYGGCNTGGSSVPWSWSFFCKKSHRSSLINLVFFMFNDCSQCVVLSVQHSYIILRVMQFRDFNILLQMYLKAISVLETNPRQMHQGILHSKALAILSATKLSQEQLILCHR
jgi:hypothetical protein